VKWFAAKPATASSRCAWEVGKEQQRSLNAS